MSDSKHTPGPWTFEETSVSPEDAAAMKRLGRKVPRMLGNGGEAPVASKHGKIADVISRIERNRKTPYDADDAERDANARLIAAAPDLLAALKRVLESLTLMVGAFRPDSPTRSALEDECRHIRAAISKAEGK